MPKHYIGCCSFVFSRHLNRLNHGKTDDVYWMKGPNCTGKENLLVNCPGIHFGDVRNCSVMSKAAVFCQKEQGKCFLMQSLTDSLPPGIINSNFNIQLDKYKVLFDWNVLKTCLIIFISLKLSNW